MKAKFALFATLACVTSAIAAGQQVSVNYNHSQSFTAVSHLRLGFQQRQHDSELNTGAGSSAGH